LNRKIIVKLIIVLVLALSTGIFASKGIETKTQANTVDAGITIDGNADFDSKANWIYG